MIERNLSERYRLEDRIGQGGMAVVYAGVDTVLRRRVAIKVLRPHLAADDEFVQRFYSEAHHAAKLSHPNIVNIYDVGRAGEDYFIVMELVDGATLGEMIEDGPLPEAVAIDFGAQICNGLAYAHRQGLLHRDVKPGNVLVTRDDVVKLSDFGIARAVSTQTMTVTQPGLVMGSVYYISPEQAQGHELHETSDLYSLGVVLFQMLSGKLPYTGESPITIALKHVSNPVPPVDADELTVSPALAAIVRKLMQKDPADRFQSAVEVGRALREAREHPTEATPVGARSNGAAATRRQRMPAPKPRPARFPDGPADTIAVSDEVVVPAVSRVPVRVAGIVTLLLAALVLAAVLSYIAFRPGAILGGPSDVAVASVVGDTLAQAERKLDTLGLGYNVIESSSETVAAHRVIRQDPPAGKRLKGHPVVNLTVSTGLPHVALIDMRHYSSDDAARYLRTVKLVPNLAGVYDANAPKGTVLAQRPAAGSSLAIHSAVTLTVSNGPQPVAVPDITSNVVADATGTLQRRKLKLTIAERDASDHIPANVIMSQDPAAGTSVSPGSTVSVVISSGPQQATVPGVDGRALADAQSALRAAGFATTIEYVVEPNADSGTVLKQNPDKGAQVKEGATVTLSVAIPGTVPDVSGKSPAEASALLQSAGYRVGNTAFTQEGTEGTVVRTEPAASTDLRPGETVMLFVSGVSGDPQPSPGPT